MRNYEPEMLNSSAQFKFPDVCPFMVESDGSVPPLCCNDDQVEILESSYQQIDGVFGSDVSICGVNLKKMWCEYACSPKQNEFTAALGHRMTIVNEKLYNLTEIGFAVDADMACTLFKSCQKVSLIA